MVKINYFVNSLSKCFCIECKTHELASGLLLFTRRQRCELFICLVARAGIHSRTVRPSDVLPQVTASTGHRGQFPAAGRCVQSIGSRFPTALARRQRQRNVVAANVS